MNPIKVLGRSYTIWISERKKEIKFEIHEGYGGQNEHSMGIRESKMTFFRPPHHGDSEPKFRIF